MADMFLQWLSREGACYCWKQDHLVSLGGKGSAGTDRAECQVDTEGCGRYLGNWPQTSDKTCFFLFAYEKEP